MSAGDFQWNESYRKDYGGDESPKMRGGGVKRTMGGGRPASSWSADGRQSKG